MAENRGVAPPDMTTPVGQVRALLGDVEYTEYDPPPAGLWHVPEDVGCRNRGVSRNIEW